MPAGIIAWVRQQFFDNNGAPLASGTLEFYDSGTTTARAVWSDADLSVSAGTIVTLNSAGFPTVSGSEIAIYLSPVNYRVVVKNSAGTTLRTVDGVYALQAASSVNLDISDAVAGEALSAGDVCYLSDGSGSLTAGRWYRADADLLYASLAPVLGFAVAAIASGGTGTIRIGGVITGLSSLTAGSTYYVSATAAAITATAPANARAIGVAVSSSALVIEWSPRALGVNVEMATAVAGEALAANDLCYLSDGSGSLTAGRWYKADADLYYASIHPVLGFAPLAIASGATGIIRLDGIMSGLSGLTAGSTYYVSGTAAALTATAPANARAVGVAISTTSLRIDFSPQWLASGDSLNLVDGRLTLTSGTAVTTADVTGATSIYFALYGGNRVALFDGSKWKVYSFAELTLALGTLTSDLPYDVFLYDNAGTLTLELLAWTNATTRATALTAQNGVLAKTGALTRRYLGTFYTTSTTATEDSFAKRFVWNYYNQKQRVMRVLETTDSWTYATEAWQQARASTANQLDFVIGVAEVPIHVYVLATGHADTVGDSSGVAIGLDSTTAKAAGSVAGYGTALVAGASAYHHHMAMLNTFPAVGRHYAVWLEWSQATGTWFGDNGASSNPQSGITGFTWA